MRTPSELFTARQHWIDGGWRSSSSTSLFEVRDPSTEEVIGTVAGGVPQDVDAAVTAARAALPGWRSAPLGDRLEVLQRICAAIDADQDTLADLITSEVGAPVAIAGPAHVGIASAILRSFVEVGRKFPFEEEVGQSLVLREPVGVVGCITPWNLPLILIAQKLGGALVAGCTVVLKPSELTPFNALRLAECLDAAGCPPGVFNVVTGDGPTTGEALASHPQVAKVSFTGSTRAGRRVATLAAQAMKRISLELGGKSANVVLPDGDLSAAVETGVHQACFNSGQSCIAWSRILVPRQRLADAADLAAGVMSKLPVGDPRDPQTHIGPLVSKAAEERVRGYVSSGLRAGARIACGGPDRPAGMDRGYYVRPTVLADVSPEMAVAREEIFGPVVCILPYGSEAEAVDIANGTKYGLHGSVWSADESHALSVARQIDSGMLNLNGYGFDPVAPFGGYKQSGIGRELGAEGLAEFLETKSVLAVRP